ncbi:hypothetical protein BDB00DRAFT_790287 [Zychaea mexicana]|uniref:uncharacterized protein n=1 Tax=Zychaea mexicana TaxID=64656 RepID=UPI0022FE4EE0|nr:uncharacterized protein BDB00DRAFT_790287 [Zychaea mexicana]KAI9490530.1 hypothetical protein BDB00DRAFT_790287 [Zychaea mexicana]
MARKLISHQYEDRMLEDELEESIAAMYDYLRKGSGGRDSDLCIVQARMAFLSDRSTRIRDHQLIVMTKMVAMHRYQELIWNWEDIYDDCACLVNTPVDENDSDRHQPRVVHFVMSAKELINDGMLELQSSSEHSINDTT